MTEPLFWANRIIESGAANPQELAKGMHPLNWRGHPEQQREALEEALDSLGILQPVLFNKLSGRVIDGHLRIELAVLKGQPLIPVNYVELSDDEEALALATLDAITEQAQPIPEKLAALLERTRAMTADKPGLAGMLEELRSRAGVNGKAEPKDAQPQIDKAAQLAEIWGTKLGQIWELGAHRLAVGDCTDKATVEAVMRGERADCGFTSPPYAVGVNYGEYQDTIENLRKMLPKLSRIWLDFIVDGGFAVINFGDIAPARNIANSDEPCEYPMAVEYWPVFRADGWLLWSRRIWCKPNPRVHSPWCIQSNRAATDWEHLWTWRKPGEPIIKRVDGELRSALGWIDTSLMHGVDVGKEVHGAGMALGISEWMINIHSRVDSIVLESFCGTGTTIISCQHLNRRCCAIELDPGYAAVTLQRFLDATGIEPRLTS